MVDFTKEELAKIVWGLYQWDSRTGHSEPNWKELENKVQFMLDNYCTHNKGKRATSEVNYVYHCPKCEEFLGWS